MANLAYRQILRMASLKINGIVGTTKTNLESAYMTTPLTATQIGNTDFTISMLSDLLVAVVGRIVRSYAMVPNHPFRTNNVSQTANIAHKGLIPSVNSASKPIVGVYGAIRNSTTGEVMTEAPVQIIRSIIDNTDSRLKGTYDYYAQMGDRLEHTAANAVIDVCTFDTVTELAAIAANGAAPIPDALLDVASSGLVASLVIDDEFVSQSQLHAAYFERCLEEMRTGVSGFMPSPNQLTSPIAGLN